MDYRPECERCHVSLSDTDSAYLCAHECTFCPGCCRKLRFVCPNCSGELVRRPRAGPAARRGERAMVPPDPGIRVRRAGPENLRSLVPLFDAYREFYEQPSDAPAAERFLHDRLARGESVVFLAEENGAAVGFTQLYPLFSSVSLGRIFVLNDLFVAPSGRRKGVGGLLLEAARSWSQSEGAHYLELSTAIDNPAQRLYEAHGWVPDREFLHYEQPLRSGTDRA
jgi:GNAT superfamily N-acetyltransferase